jgi:hypothetical protein
MRCVPDPNPVGRPHQPVRPRTLLRPAARCWRGQRESVFDQHAPKRGWRHPHQTLVGAAVGELAVRAVDGAPTFGDVEDGGDLLGQQRMDRMPAWRLVDQGGGVAAACPPAMHPRVGHLPQRARPGMGEPGRDRVVDRLQNQLLHLGGDPRRHWPDQPQPDFPRTTASSIACALTASVSSAISALAASNCQSR